MIEPLRKIHARAFHTLGIVLPLLVVGGVRHRQPLPGAPPQRFQFSNLAPLAEQTLQVNGSRAKLGVFESREGIAFHISSGNDLHAPDVLVYASAAEPKEMVRGDAKLLGEFAPDKLYRLSGDEFRFVFLYSLGHQQVLASFPLRVRS
jgi:hypothetical protein